MRSASYVSPRSVLWLTWRSVRGVATASTQTWLTFFVSPPNLTRVLAKDKFSFLQTRARGENERKGSASQTSLERVSKSTKREAEPLCAKRRRARKERDVYPLFVTTTRDPRARAKRGRPAFRERERERV